MYHLLFNLEFRANFEIIKLIIERYDVVTKVTTLADAFVSGFEAASSATFTAASSSSDFKSIINDNLLMPLNSYTRHIMTTYYSTSEAALVKPSNIPFALLEGCCISCYLDLMQMIASFDILLVFYRYYANCFQYYHSAISSSSSCFMDTSRIDNWALRSYSSSFS